MLNPDPNTFKGKAQIHLLGGMDSFVTWAFGFVGLAIGGVIISVFAFTTLERTLIVALAGLLSLFGTSVVIGLRRDRADTGAREKREADERTEKEASRWIEQNRGSMVQEALQASL